MNSIRMRQLLLLAVVFFIGPAAQSFANQSTQLGKPKMISDRKMQLGAHYISVEKSIAKKTRPVVFSAIENSLRDIYADTPNGPTLASVAPKIFVRRANRYNRYTGWHMIAQKPTLVVSSSFLLDTDRQFLTKAMTYEMERMSGAFKSKPDPYRRTIDGISLVGSIYSDIKNKKFFAIVEKALEMSEKLPPHLQKYIKTVNEIRYNPPSKYFKKMGGIDGAVAYYNRSLSSPQKRMIFIRRKMLYSSPLDTLLSLAHEGNHALQHQTAEKYLINHKRGNLAPNEKEFLDAWYRVDRTRAGNQKFVQMFECEATRTEIDVARSLNVSPNVVENSSYLNVCKKAKRKLVKWKNERFKKANKS